MAPVARGSWKFMISTRPLPPPWQILARAAFVQTGDNKLIGGFILGSNGGGAQVIVRAIGPSIAQLGNTLADPTLELRDGNGGLIRFDDNWQDDSNQAALISASGLAPANPLESAIAATLLPGNYTAIVAGKNNGTRNRRRRNLR